MTVFLKCDSRFAVRQKMQMCGKAIEDERDERVAEEVQRRNPLPRQQRAVDGDFESESIAAPKPPIADPMTLTAIAPNMQEQHRLQRVDPGRAAHPAEEHVAHDHERDDGAAEPERHEAAADGRERRAAAHHGDDDVRHQQHGLHREDQRADVPALPAVAEQLHGRHEAVPVAERPEARADRRRARAG